jgi:hypothetical protein
MFKVTIKIFLVSISIFFLSACIIENTIGGSGGFFTEDYQSNDTSHLSPF